MSEQCQFILDFMQNWERFDLEGALSCLAEDATFTPDLISAPIAGRAEIRKLWSFYMEMMQGYEMKLRNIASGGNVVFLERTEYVVTPMQEHVALDIVGVFELDRDGKIGAWRDYVESTKMP